MNRSLDGDEVYIELYETNKWKTNLIQNNFQQIHGDTTTRSPSIKEKNIEELTF